LIVPEARKKIEHQYPAGKFLAVTFAGAVGWLLLIYLLFNYFGLAASFVFGLRWITALAVVLFGGATTVLVAARSRKQVSLSVPRETDGQSF
jgi:membrane protein DedA with SNARE-associated domain